MKKIILVISGSLLALATFSQPTITEFMNLDVGDKYWMKDGGTGISTSMITQGPNQIWDFSNLPTDAIPIGGICVTPTSTPYADSLEVQNSNMAIKPYGAENDTIFNYQFLRIGDSEMESLAMGLYHNYDKVSVNYTKWLDPFIGMKVPMTYGSSYTDRQVLWLYNIAQTAPIVKDTSDITVAAVGFGTVKTPAGTFENALLFKETINWIWWNNYGLKIYKTQGTDVTYQWRVPGIKLGVLSVCIPDGSGGNVSYLWQTEFKSGGIDNPNSGGNGNGGNNGGSNETPYAPNGIWLNTMSAGGEFFQHTIGSLSWTMGEAITETMMVNPTLSQGFNQPSDVVVSAKKLKELQVKVYPNPFTSDITIDFGVLNKEVEATVYSATGQIIRNIKITNPVSRLNLNECKPGIYYLRINNPDHLKTFTIIKK